MEPATNVPLKSSLQKICILVETASDGGRTLRSGDHLYDSWTMRTLQPSFRTFRFSATASLLICDEV